MKILKIILLSLLFTLPSIQQAQVSVNVTIGSPPAWGPVGYPEVRYYYLPDVEAYYDVHTSMFIYYGGGVWMHRSSLPWYYRHYDLYNGYKVVMLDYRGESPHITFKDYKVKYKKGYRGPAQKTIGPKHGSKQQAKSNNKGKSLNESPKQQKEHKQSSGKSNSGGGGKGHK